MISKFVTRMTLALAIGLVMAWASPVEAASYCDSPPESKKVQVMGDWLPWAIHGPIYMAQDAWKGYYAAEGIEVELLNPASSGRSLEDRWRRQGQHRDELSAGRHGRPRSGGSRR